MSYEFRGPELTDNQERIGEQLLSCADDRGCELARSAILNACIDDGIIYDLEWALKRVVFKVEPLLEASELHMDCSESCKETCMLANINHKSIE